MLVGCDAENNRQKTSTGFSEGFYRDYIQLLGSKVEVLYIDLWNFILMEVFVNLGEKIALYLSHIYDNFHQYKILGSYLGILCHVVSNANKIDCSFYKCEPIALLAPTGALIVIVFYYWSDSTRYIVCICVDSFVCTIN